MLADSLSTQASLLGDLAASHLEPVLRRYDLGLGTFDLLATVHSSGATATQAAIAEALGITPPSLTEAVQAAVRKKIIEQTQAADDARAKRLRLTRKGKAILEECLNALSEVEQRSIRGIPRKELETAIRVLKQAQANLKQPR